MAGLDMFGGAGDGLDTAGALLAQGIARHAAQTQGDGHLPADVQVGHGGQDRPPDDFVDNLRFKSQALDQFLGNEFGKV